MKKITDKMIENFEEYLKEEEKAPATIIKYIRDVACFSSYLNGQNVTKRAVIEYKRILMEKYSPSSVNAALSSLNSFFIYMKEYSLKVKFVKVQKSLFINEEKELTKSEYQRLLVVAKKRNKRLYLIMQTICSTGIRVSELQFITVEALCEGQAQINCKGKLRRILIPADLCRVLKKYAKTEKIIKGSVFITKGGKPIDRSNIHHDMKKLCQEASVPKQKVFPHNLRHLFARTYYHIQRDVVRLADILGHSSINTTRIYTIESGEIHRRQIQKLGLLQC